MGKFREFLNESPKNVKQFDALMDKVYKHLDQMIADSGHPDKKSEKRVDVLGKVYADLEKAQKEANFILKQL